MSFLNDKFNQPELEDPADLGYAPYRVDSQILWPLRKMRANRGASYEDAMLMIGRLIPRFQATYRSHSVDTSLILMPYLPRQPRDGDKIKNITTGEIYTVKETIVNPYTKAWEGLIRLNCNTAPNAKKAERLQFIDPLNVVRFIEDGPQMIGNEDQTSSGIIIDKGPMPPTVVYSLIRKEPGSIGKQPFGPAKDYRRRVREHVKDNAIPGHTIEVRGQAFDNLVQFDCCTTDNVSASRLVNWFEKFMNLYEWVLKKNGVQQILYWQRKSDAAVPKWRQDLVVRTVQYYFRTEDVEAVIRRDLTNINYAIDLAEDILDTTERYIADQKVTGLVSEDQYRSLFRDSNGTYLFGTIDINDGNLT